MYFLFFVGMGSVGFPQSMDRLRGYLFFWFRAVFLFVLGWGKKVFCWETMLTKWDEDGRVRGLV